MPSQTLGLRLGRGRIEQPRPVQMPRQPVAGRQRGGLLHVVKRQQLAAQRVLQRQQPGAGKVGVVGLDGGFNLGQRQRAVRRVVQGLRLHTAQHGSTAALPAVGVRHLAHDVLVAALAVRKNSAQVALRAGGHEQRRLKPQQRRQLRLQGVDAGVVGKHVVTQRRGQHGVAHGRRGLRDGVAAQIDPRIVGFMHD